MQMMEFDKTFMHFIQQNKSNSCVKIKSQKFYITIYYDKEEYGKNFKDFKKSLENVINFSDLLVVPARFYISTQKEAGEFIRKCFDLKDFGYAKEVEAYNNIVNKKSEAKISNDKKYIIIRFKSGLLYIVNRITLESLVYVSDNIEALSMLNLLVATPFVLVGELYVAHAGVVTDGERNILLYNDSLGGKTSFGFLFFTNGWDIVAEDVVYFSNKGQVVDFLFRKYFHVRKGTEAYFSELFRNDKKVYFNYDSKKELFELGKEKQISIPYTSLCVRKHFSKENTITDVIMVNIDKEKKQNVITDFSKDIFLNKVIEMCNLPTITIFNEIFPNLKKISKKQQRYELVECMKDVKSYRVEVGLEYKDFFCEILECIRRG